MDVIFGDTLTIDGNGRPRIEGRIIDASAVPPQLPSRVCVLGATNMGKPYEVLPVNSWADFVSKFGGLHEDSEFPQQCKNVLDNGGKLYVARVAHWTGTAWQGTKATGTITVLTNSIIFTAKEVGKGYNAVSIQIKEVFGNATKVDIVETFEGRTTTVRVAKAGVDVDAVALNTALKYTSVSVFPTALPIGSVTLTGGDQTFASLVNADWIGNAETETKGFYAFDNTVDTMDIANLDRPVPAVDKALLDYCALRGNMFALTQTPQADADAYQTMLDYRNGTGAYSHTPLNTIFGALTTGNDLVKDTTALGGTSYERSIGKIVANMSKKNSAGQNGNTLTGPNRGIIPNSLGVEYDAGLSSRKEIWNLLDDNGLNVLVRDHVLNNATNVSELQTVLYGNNSLLLDRTTGSTLKNLQVCYTLIWLNWQIKPILKSFIDEPNKPETWRKIFDRVSVPIQQAIGLGWIKPNAIWVGDQNARTSDDWTINNEADVADGIYRTQLFVMPTPSIKYVQFDIINTRGEGTTTTTLTV